ncbi:MAG: methyl-accepting chemotaxis protein, partial [Burkholderiales bacterium]|nr:methyl-accepting chemotaxis protein [Burkholderiales bacterium]
MKLTFRTRLYAGFALVIAVFLCVIGITVTKIEHARKDVGAIKEEALKLQLANQWLANIRQNSARSLAVARSPGKDMLVFFKEPMAAVSADTTKTQKAFLEAATSPADKKLADKLGEVRAAWLATRDEINKLKDAGDDAGAAQLVDSRFVPITDQYVAVAQELVNGQLAEVDRNKAEIEQAFASLYTWLAVMTFLAILIAVLVSWRFGRSLVNALTDARASAEKIGHGDLVAPINSHSDDEVGQLMQSLEQARQALEKVISQTRQVSDNIQVA